MVSPFQAQQYSDPRIQVLQNAYNAQNKKDLTSMALRNRTLNQGMRVGGSLLMDYFERANDRRQAKSALESMGMEDFGEGNIGIDELTDLMTADTNANNAYINEQNVRAKTLPYMDDNEVMGVAQGINAKLNNMPSRGFTFGRRPAAGAQTTFAATYGGRNPAVPSANENLTPVSETTGTLDQDGGMIIDEQTVPKVPTEDEMIEETIANLEGTSPTSPIMRERVKDKPELSSAESTAVSDRMEAKRDLRRDNQMGYFAQRSPEEITNKFGEITTIIPNESTKAKVEVLRTAANANDDTAMRDYFKTSAAEVDMIDSVLKTGSDILEIYARDGFITDPDLFQSMGEGLRSFGRNVEAAASKKGFGTSSENKDLTSSFDVFTNQIAKNLAKALEGGGRLSDFDFNKSLEQLGNMEANPDLFRRKFFKNSQPMLKDVIESQQALGNVDSAERMANDFMKLGQAMGVEMEVGEDGVPVVTGYKNFKSKPEEEKAVEPAAVAERREAPQATRQAPSDPLRVRIGNILQKYAQ